MTSAIANSPPARKPYRMKDLTALLGVTDETLRKWVKAGVFPQPYRIAGTRFVAWDAAVVDAFLASQREGNAHAAG